MSAAISSEQDVMEQHVSNYASASSVSGFGHTDASMGNEFNSREKVDDEAQDADIEQDDYDEVNQGGAQDVDGHTEQHINEDAATSEPHGYSSPLLPTRYRVPTDRKSTRLNSSHSGESRMPSSA